MFTQKQHSDKNPHSAVGKFVVKRAAVLHTDVVRLFHLQTE